MFRNQWYISVACDNKYSFIESLYPVLCVCARAHVI